MTIDRDKPLTRKQWEALWMVALGSVTFRTRVHRLKTTYFAYTADGKTNIDSRMQQLRRRKLVSFTKDCRYVLTEKGCEWLDPKSIDPKE